MSETPPFTVVFRASSLEVEAVSLGFLAILLSKFEILRSFPSSKWFLTSLSRKQKRYHPSASWSSDLFSRDVLQMSAVRSFGAIVLML